ncbi:MAG: hypothetical protein N2039_00590 [Gemmataceae bacterium]|nr:hypothetical protein [Gemmataceae bacterium]
MLQVTTQLSWHGSQQFAVTTALVWLQQALAVTTPEVVPQVVHAVVGQQVLQATTHEARRIPRVMGTQQVEQAVVAVPQLVQAGPVTVVGACAAGAAGAAGCGMG